MYIIGNMKVNLQQFQIEQKLHSIIQIGTDIQTKIEQKSSAHVPKFRTWPCLFTNNLCLRLTLNISKTILCIIIAV